MAVEKQVAGPDFSSLIRSLEIKLKRQEESVKDTKAQLEAVGRMIEKS